MTNTTVQFIQQQLEFARVETLRVAESAPESARLFQPGEGRPTILWLLGHLASTISAVAVRWCLRGEHVFPKEHAKLFAPDFGGGDPPSTDAAKYPPYDEVVRLYDEAMTKAIAALGVLTDEDLEKPLPVALPAIIVEKFPTIGKSLQRMIGHDSYHRGQMAMLAKIAK